MTNTYDWLVIGGGLTGAALAYELQKIGLAVVVIESQPLLPRRPGLDVFPLAPNTSNHISAHTNTYPKTATSSSYGGIPYWAAHNPTMAQFAQQSWQRYGELATELVSETLPDLELRTLDLLLTVGEAAPIPELFAYDPANGARTKLSWLSRAEVIDLEPALAQAHPQILKGALLAKHGHINPIKLVQGYLQSFQRLGGEIIPAQALALKRDGCRVVGIETDQGDFYAMDLAICGGAWSRRLLQESGIPSLAEVIYFTHAEVLLMSPPASVTMPQAMVLPAVTDRFAIESAATTPEQRHHWQDDNHEFLPSSLDIGVIPFLDGTLRFGQVSRVHSNPDLVIEPHQSEAMLREGMKLLLPQLHQLPAHWDHSLVAFSQDSLPLVGALPEPSNVHLFTGFTTPFAYVPGLAAAFAANCVASAVRNAPMSPQAMLQELSPTRFLTEAH